MGFIIRTGRPDEWQEILDVSHAAFDRDGSFFPCGWPHTYPGPEAADWFVVAEEKGRIVGVVNQTPCTVNVGGAKLKAVGLGGVGVHPEARKRGVMSAMLAASNAQQKAAGTVLGFLAGARLRYRRHGYELAGQATTATVQKHDLGDVEPVAMRELTIADAKDVLRLCRRTGMFVWRDEAWQRRLLRREGFIAHGNKTGPLRAYYVTGRNCPTRLSELVGDAKLLPGVLKAYCLHYDKDAAPFCWVPGYRPHLALGRIAAPLATEAAPQVGLFDFGRFLRAVAKPIGKRFASFGLRGVRVRHTGERSVYDLTLGRSGGLSVKPAAGRRRPDLSLGAAEWVRTFFPPPGGPMLSANADERLTAALRLPLAFSNWDCV